MMGLFIHLKHTYLISYFYFSPQYKPEVKHFNTDYIVEKKRIPNEINEQHSRKLINCLKIHIKYYITLKTYVLINNKHNKRKRIS
jgi:hypothetical protein